MTRSRGARHLAGASIAAATLAGAPAIASAHGLTETYQSPLPLAVYLVGAALTVALSFVLVLARDLRATPPTAPRPVRVPAAIRWALRAAGIIGWAWIIVQALAGGSSDAAVAGLFLWVYGWVGIAMVSALVFPAWEWLDPFATLFDAGAWALRRTGVRGWTPVPLPARLRHWPAVAGLAFFTWLELVAVPGGQTLAIALIGYTVLTLALMAQFGRDRWRAEGDTFTVWFRTLNRLAPFGVDQAAPCGPVVLRRQLAAGVLEGPWTSPLIALVAVATAGIIFDGISQTVPFVAVFGPPVPAQRTVLLLAWLGVVAGAALWVGRAVSPGAIGAGLLPISVGYLVAHYLTYLLFDGQRIVIAVSDPLQQGQDLFGTAFYTVQTGWLPPGLVWTAQLVAVVGGHMLGAWAGHVTAQRDMDAASGNGHVSHAGNGSQEAHDLRHRRIRDTTPLRTRNLRAREIPLAIVMVALTTITLWSLGQAIVVEQAVGAAPGVELALSR